MADNEDLDGVFGYGNGDKTRKKFSIFFSMDDPAEKNIWEKLARINPGRRNYLIIDILDRYFKSGSTEEQLVDALENLTIFIRDIKKIPALIQPPVIQQTMKMTQTETVKSIEVSQPVPSGKEGGFVNNNVSMEEILNSQPKIVPVEQPKVDMDALISNIFESGIQK